MKGFQYGGMNSHNTATSMAYFTLTRSVKVKSEAEHPQLLSCLSRSVREFQSQFYSEDGKSVACTLRARHDTDT